MEFLYVVMQALPPTLLMQLELLQTFSMAERNMFYMYMYVYM